ncbi:MAG: hypothetical protein ABW184_09700 [Sphingobium sp.]
MLTISYDEDNGIVCTVADRIVSPADFDRHLPQYRELLGRSRARHGRSLHLVDATFSPVQTRDTFRHISQLSSGTILPDDRCALIVKSTLHRLQMSRLPHGETRRFFTDRDAAMEWLLEERQASRAGVTP